MSPNYKSFIFGKMNVKIMMLMSILIFSSSSRLFGQSTAIASHWGASMFPTFEPRKEISLHFFGFTEFGKEIDAEGNYIFEPYNDISNTLGFNVVSFSNTRTYDRDVVKSNFLKRNILILGLIDDTATEWLQNEVIHRSNIKGSSKLLRVPRRIGEANDDVRPADTKSWPVIGFSQEFNLRFRSRSREKGQSGIAYRPLPFFIGSGWSIGSVNQEAFFQIGALSQDIELPSPLRRPFNYVGVTGLSGGAMLRSGLLLPGVIFKDLTASYAQFQGSIKIHWRIFEFPITTEFLVSSHTGFFVEKRSQEILDEIEERGQTPADVYKSKLAKRERYISVKLEFGKFVFESFNDTFGGKDTGPSFGANVSLIVSASDLNYIFKFL